MTYYLIAKDEAGAIIATRASQSRPFAFATRQGTFHSRRDLVPAGQKAYPVEQISGPEFRALTRAKTEAPDLLRKKLAGAEKGLAGNRQTLAKLEHMASLDATLLPSRTVEVTAYRPDHPSRFQVECLYEGEWVRDYIIKQAPENADRFRRYVAESETRVANLRKRLAAAERRAVAVAQAARLAAKA